MAEVKQYEPHNITQEELKKLQAIELEILIEFDRVCKEAGVKYSLDGGTLLGAIRHKGFIPWDDDIDLIMLRGEYAKFKRACKEKLDTSRFFLQDYTTDPQYRWGYAKLRRKNTEFVRYGQEHIKQHSGIFADIFVVDDVPDNPIIRRLHHFACFLIRKGLYSEVGKVNEKNPAIRKIYEFMSRIPRNTYFKWRNNLARIARRGAIRSGGKTELISHYTLEYPAHCRYGLPRSCFDEFIETEFEGRMFPMFKDYDLYLGTYYGDYMKMPPKEKQVPHLTVSKLILTEPEL